MKGYKYFLDTNIFLRIIAKDNQSQLLESESLINKITHNKIKAYTSSLVLAEIVWTCFRGYKLNKEEVNEFLRSILAIKNLRFEEKANVFVASEMFVSRGIKFADCLIASHPQILNGQMIVVSYDKDFDKLGVKRLEPVDI